MLNLNDLVTILVAGMAAGGLGDLIAESTLFEKVREWAAPGASSEGSLLDCRFCVAGQMLFLTVPLALYFEAAVPILALPAAFKVITGTRGWYG
jgi:hypothetical protein